MPRVFLPKSVRVLGGKVTFDIDVKPELLEILGKAIQDAVGDDVRRAQFVRHPGKYLRDYTSQTGSKADVEALLSKNHFLISSDEDPPSDDNPQPAAAPQAGSQADPKPQPKRLVHFSLPTDVTTMEDLARLPQAAQDNYHQLLGFVMLYGCRAKM